MVARDRFKYRFKLSGFSHDLEPFQENILKPSLKENIKFRQLLDQKNEGFGRWASFLRFFFAKTTATTERTINSGRIMADENSGIITTSCIEC